MAFCPVVVSERDVCVCRRAGNMKKDVASRISKCRDGDIQAEAEPRGWTFSRHSGKRRCRCWKSVRVCEQREVAYQTLLWQLRQISKPSYGLDDPGKDLTTLSE
jgi:hypothetical protein